MENFVQKVVKNIHSPETAYILDIRQLWTELTKTDG